MNLRLGAVRKCGDDTERRCSREVLGIALCGASGTVLCAAHGLDWREGNLIESGIGELMEICVCVCVCLGDTVQVVMKGTRTTEL